MPIDWLADIGASLDRELDVLINDFAPLSEARTEVSTR